MSASRAEREKQRQIQEKCQAILGNLLREEDNKYCVDCDAKGPRWASWNLGVFLCIRCAGIHRNLGVHISKVKSVNLDTWTPEQVACLQQMGNSQARAVYEANLPDNFRRPQTDSSLEAFIRSKYEQKKYIAKEWVPPPPPKPAFDIEEERRLEKEKRKTRSKITSSVEIPQVLQQPSAVPRPHSAGPLSPSPVAVTQEAKSTHSQPQSSGTEDLLSLDISNTEQSEDPFDAFLSAPPLPVPTNNSLSSVPAGINDTTTSSNSKTSEEADFFNQTVGPDTFKANKMTKESILSLYGSSGTQPQSAPQQPSMYGLPGGMYVTPQMYPPQVGISGVPAASQIIANGITGVSPQIPGIQSSAVSMSSASNPFATLGGPAMGHDMTQHTGTWIPPTAAAVGTNPLLVAQGIGQLQQQMASLQLSGQAWNVTGVGVPQVASTGLVIGGGQPAAGMAWPNAAHGQTLSTNLWQ